MNILATKVRDGMLCMQRCSWEQGFGATALMDAGEENLVVAMAADALLHAEKDGRLAMVGSDHVITDTGTNGEPMLFAYQCTGELRYWLAAENLQKYFLQKAPKTPDGILYHFYRTFHEGFTPFQIWADACFMVPPFLAAVGCVGEAVLQMEGFFRYLLDQNTGALFHVYDFGSRRFVRRLLWSIGNGWALLGLVRTAAAAQKNGELATAERLRHMMCSLLKAMLNFQREDGLFHDILDRQDTFLDGTSAMMMAGCIYRGVYEGWLNPSYLCRADNVYETMCKKIDNVGIIHEVCGSPDFTHSGTSAEAQASFLIMDAWREKIREEQRG